MKFLPIFIGIAAVSTLAAAPQRAATPKKPTTPPPRSAAPATDATVPFKVGETLTYDASWSSFVTAGQVKMRVADRQSLGGGRSGYHFVTEAQTVSLAAKMYQVYYKIESVLDTSSLAAVRASSYSNERGRERVKSIWFGSKNIGSYEIKRGEVWKGQVALPPRTLDPLGAMYIARVVRANPGETLVIPIVDGDTLSRLRLAFGNRESVKTGLGAANGWRVTMTMTDMQGKSTGERPLTVWLSDDTQRRPLRFEGALAIGSITLALAKAQ